MGLLDQTDTGGGDQWGDALGDLYSRLFLSTGRAADVAQPQTFPYAGNPVGTQNARQEFVSASREGDFDPVVGQWPTGKPMTASEHQGIKDFSINLFSQLANAAGPVEAPQVPGGPVSLARVRPGRPGPLRRFMPPEVPEARTSLLAGEEPPPAPAPTSLLGDVPEGPEGPGIGHNRPPRPARKQATPAGPAAPLATPAGRLGSNADDELAALGLPSYDQIVPSTNTGPVTEAQKQQGTPVRLGQVMDLTNTWQVPGGPQEDLSRIDPYGGRRKGLPDHILNVMSDPDMAAKLRMVAEEGLKAGGAYWYNAEPLKQAFQNELGLDEGTKQFNRYMSIVGATSAGSDVGQNIRAASYYHVKERQGDPVQSKADLISPYGHKNQDAHISGYLGLDTDGGLSTETQPKRASFVENLQGNQQPITGDKHNMRLIGMLSQDPGFLNTKTEADVNYPALGITKGESRNWRDEVASGNITMEQALQHPHMWSDMPDKNHYGALEAWQQNIAQSMGLTPAQFQAALWVGGGRVTGLRSLPTSFLGSFENRLTRTAAARNISPADALRAFVQGKAPLLTPLAMGGAAAAAYGNQDNQQ